MDNEWPKTHVFGCSARPTKRICSVAARFRLWCAPLLCVFYIGCGPVASPGGESGARCVRNLDCAVGLVCECETCVDADGATDPPVCNVTPDTDCSSEPSLCYEACGLEVVVGLAECVNGAELCTESGVLQSDCPPDTCWGDPEAGEICVDGAYQCQAGTAPNGECYTFDCPDNEAELCVLSCEDENPTAQACIASRWQCESGFPVRQCGGCVGSPPLCYDNCENRNELFNALCVDNEWSCTGVLVDAGVLPDTCSMDGGIWDGGWIADGGTTQDAGEVDAGLPIDAGLDIDAGGPFDADGGPMDGGFGPDSGSQGMDADAGAPDAGAPDAGAPDAGEETDSGQMAADAGSEPDPDGGAGTDGGMADAGAADGGSPAADAG
jgi:hypothetical protein